MNKIIKVPMKDNDKRTNRMQKTSIIRSKHLVSIVSFLLGMISGVALMVFMTEVYLAEADVTIIRGDRIEIREIPLVGGKSEDVHNVVRGTRLIDAFELLGIELESIDAFVQVYGADFSGSVEYINYESDQEERFLLEFDEGMVVDVSSFNSE